MRYLIPFSQYMKKPNLLLCMFLFSISGVSLAHEGHDDAAPASQVVSTVIARASAQSELFELVAVPEQQQLTIYLDRFTDNVPVSGASLELESEGWQGVAKEVSAGAYTVTAPFLAKPGQHNLLFTITKGDDADLLEVSLDIKLPENTASATAVKSPLLKILILGISVAVLLLLFILLRHRRLLVRR